jgi:hypothetical protein
MRHLVRRAANLGRSAFQRPERCAPTPSDEARDSAVTKRLAPREVAEVRSVGLLRDASRGSCERQDEGADIDNDAGLHGVLLDRRGPEHLPVAQIGLQPHDLGNGPGHQPAAGAFVATQACA